MRILAVGAHPDDIEITCAGTLARYATAGHEAHIAILCNGDCGSMTLPPEEISAIRKQESENAAQIIGARLHWMGYGDLGALETLETSRHMADVVRQARPDLILAPPPNDYMLDHRVASQLAEDGSFIATLPNVRTGNPPHGIIVPIFYVDTVAGLDFQPTEYVDITDTFETKRRMLLCHASQTTWLKEHDAIDVDDMMETIARFRGAQCGVRYAEGFRQARLWGRMTAHRLLP